MHCQQGLGTKGRPRNEEQEQCCDKAAYPQGCQVTFRQIPGTVGEGMQGMEAGALSGSYLHGVLRELPECLPLQTLRKQRQGMQGPVFSDW